MKDIIVHPIQMALAAEAGASATVLMACVLGPALKDMMDMATTMGTETIVEVHTPAECQKALEYGATVIMMNNWDRITGKLYPKQTMGLRYMVPDEILTIAAGGIDSAGKAAMVSDEGYDGVVLGRALAAAERAGGGGMEGLVGAVAGRVGLPRNFLGMGASKEDLFGE
ncbi:unnamed protein product [Discosporangium mesarthrocarpum]